MTLIKDSIQARSRRPSKTRHVTGNDRMHNSCTPEATSGGGESTLAQENKHHGKYYDDKIRERTLRQ